MNFIMKNANEYPKSISNPFKESFYGEINGLIAFFISRKNFVKTFLKWIVNQCPNGTR